MNAKELVPYNIKRLIEINGSSQTELAHAIDREILTVHHYTKGLRFPKPENMDAICEFFKIPLTELFREKAAPDPVEKALETLAINLGYEIKKKS